MNLKINDFVALESKQTYITENPVAEELLPIGCGA